MVDLATSHASSVEAIYVIFCKHKDKVQAKPMDEARDHNQRIKGKKDSWRCHDSEFVEAVDRVHKQKTSKLNHISFDRIVKMPCHNHGYLVKHTLKECDLVKCYFSGDYKTIDTDTLSGHTDNKEKGMRILT